ncbi:hypothetical protein RSOLAG1IB_10929 [Rhizoctonia solani AG-1 IB]|uniref:Uncharacterized protein n=1 Tax=Thanatephorus cucumeris (strain AG1-IB / isolate 7/3/14) TaxID=1108050 RepID=A0A0B7G163_THACB|nr:hypothetical protein RSOLAG1IB_10929 [Rhizoctonia solani AG-1 IB]
MPLAGMLVERESGINARITQEKHAFPLQGEPMDSAAVSSELHSVFVSHVGSDGMNLQNYRQFSNAIAKRYAPYLKDPAVEHNSSADSQSAHVSHTAHLVYGTAIGCTQHMTPLDCLHYCRVSLVWASLILPINDLSEEERKEVAQAKGIPMSQLGPFNNAGTLPLAMGEHRSWDGFDYKLLAEELYTLGANRNLQQFNTQNNYKLVAQELYALGVQGGNCHDPFLLWSGS